MDGLLYQYCQKLVIFSPDRKSTFLCRRKGEADYDGVYSFIAGKMEHKDANALAGLKREKDEEVGEGFRVKVFPHFTTQEEYRKKDGSYMILPHFFALYVGGEVVLNPDEYDDFKWVPLDELEAFEPKVHTVAPVVKRILWLAQFVDEKEMVEI